MDFPDFFAEAPAITLRDPLAVFLGASKSGIMTYSYADAVKLAGHSCPTVAGAYLVVRSGLIHLYADELPERGGMEVYLRGARNQGTTGVIACRNAAYWCCAEAGFGGIGPDGWFARRDLLHLMRRSTVFWRQRRELVAEWFSTSTQTRCRPRPKCSRYCAKLWPDKQVKKSKPNLQHSGRIAWRVC